MISHCEMIIASANHVTQHACTAMATWHTGMQIVLVSTHLTELHQIQPKTSKRSPEQVPISCESTRSAHIEHADTMKMAVIECACAPVRLLLRPTP